MGTLPIHLSLIAKLRGAEVKQKLVKHFPEVEGPTVDAAVEYWPNHIKPKHR